jgi:hypothetical protein
MPVTFIKKFTKPVQATIDQLSWLTGAWQGKHDSYWAEEVWSEPHEGTIIGSHRRHIGDKLAMLDIVNITEYDNVIKYCLRRIEKPHIQSEHFILPAVFILAHITDSECIFVHEDESHPFWILYRRDNIELTGLTCDSFDQLDYVTTFEYEKYL